jgi:hypothetical protein
VTANPARVRSRVRTQWLALGAALVVLAGVLVAWALTNAADRVQVVQVADDVRAGDIIGRHDLTLTGVAFDAGVRGLVPATSLEAVIGKVASVDLRRGALLTDGAWTDAPELTDGEHLVGAVLEPGRYPRSLARGDVATAASTDSTSATPPSAVRVIDAERGAGGEMVVTLAVPASQAVGVAQLAATEQLVLVVGSLDDAS